jgi:hypothetical protein
VPEHREGIAKRAVKFWQVSVSIHLPEYRCFRNSSDAPETQGSRGFVSEAWCRHILTTQRPSEARMQWLATVTFFESPQAAAKYKHKLIKSYIPAWAGKVGSTSPNKRVVVYDACSGPGRYQGNEPGSPELLVDTAAAMATLRSVYSVFSEKDKSYCERLNAMLEEKGVDPYTYDVRVGPVEDHMDTVIADAGDRPLFVFLDPVRVDDSI